MACYLEPEISGDLNTTRLKDLRYDLEKGNLMPLEYLLSFRSGAGIHKLASDYALLGYEQSWALVYFLMSEPYRTRFQNYIRDLMKQGNDFDADKDVALLEKHIGKTLKEIEAEFKTFVAQMTQEKIDPEGYEDYKFMRIMSE
jgi:hypothetical protein